MAEVLPFAPRPVPEDAMPLIRLFRACIELAALAGRPLSLPLIAEIMQSSPRSREQVIDDSWAAQSTCSRCIMDAEARLDAGCIAEAEFDRILNFWMTVYVVFDASVLRGAERLCHLLVKIPVSER